MNIDEEILISIVVPIYNVELYLRRCVNSLINQTYKKIEIILVDDGSTDRCGEICDEYAKTDNRVRVIHKTNGGLSEARNEGIEISTGDYIMFVDSDDWVVPQTCELLARCIEKYKVDVVSFGMQLVSDNRTLEIRRVNTARFILSNEAVLSMVYRPKDEGLFNYVCNKIFRRSLFESIRFPIGMLFEDQDVTYKLFHKSKSVYAVDDILYNYYQRGDSIMSNYYLPRGLHDRISIWLKRYSFLCKFYPDYSKYQLAYVLGEIYIALIKLRKIPEYAAFVRSIDDFAHAHSNEEKEMAKYRRMIRLHYYCYPLFYLYVKFLLK